MINLAEKRKEVYELIQEARSLNKDVFAEGEKEKFDAKMKEIEELKDLIEREERVQALEMDNPIIEDKNNKPNEPETRGFKSLGEQLMAVVASSRSGAKVVHRLIEVRTAHNGANESVTSDGGYLVQTEFSNELLKSAYETGILASRVRRIPLSNPNANGITINGVDESDRANGSRWGGIVLYWLNEAGLKVPSRPKFKQIELKLKKLIGLCYATDELLQDASALEGIIKEAFAEEFGFVMDDMILEGNGAGQPLGFINGGSLISVTRTTALKTDYADICSMYSRMLPRSRDKAIWLINQDVEPQLFQMLNGTVPAYMPAGGISGQPYGTLFNKPVIPIEQARALGYVGDISFVDLSQYLMIDKGGIQTASSIHVSFLYDEQVFRFVYRVDGMPANNKAITPFKGVTKSPFVALTEKLT
jgi:HK97 family phage major capsid protein